MEDRTNENKAAPAIVHFVGAGPGAPDLITRRGAELLQRADVVVYAGSLVNPALLEYVRPECEIHNSAEMTLEEVLGVLVPAARAGRTAVRLHTGDPSLYGAIREQIDELERLGIACAVTPGVSSFAAAAAAMGMEYTLPGVSQTLIISRMSGRTPTPDGEDLKLLASHRTSMALFLSSGMVRRVCDDLIAGGYPPETKAALAYKVSWPEQKVVCGDLATLAGLAEAEGIDRTALILVGDFLGDVYERSKLYDPTFAHGCRDASAALVPELKIAYVAFTADGIATALKLKNDLGGAVSAPARFAAAFPGRVEPLPGSVADWTAAHFGAVDALVFVSAAGIAVRAIAPHVESKTADPAVIVLDDLGRNAISLLSGHIGGANDLARRIAGIVGGTPVVTTSTDLHGIEAADGWAVTHGMTVENPEAIKSVSSAMLAGVPVGVAITEETVTPPWPVTLWLRPRNLVLGVGCRRGVDPAALAAAIADFLDGAGVSPLSVAAIASLNIKRDEVAVVSWAEMRNVPFMTYTARALQEQEGDFTPSERVMEETGTDNVCERAAVAAGRDLFGEAVLMRSKTKYPGITLALVKERGGRADAE